MTIHDKCGPLWNEGMFLTPQHLQQMDRYQDAVQRLKDKADVPFAWGINRIEIDEDSLANYRFVIHRLEAITPEGEPLFFPGNVEIASRTFEGVFNNPAQTLNVYLGIPDYVSNGANLSDEDLEGHGGELRYGAAEIGLSDENTGQSERTVLLRRLRGRLLIEGEDSTGYMLIPLAKIRSDQEMNGAILDSQYCPPILRLGSWPTLLNTAQGIATRLVSTQTNLAGAIGERELVELCASPRGIELLLKTQAVNQAVNVLNQISRIESSSPYLFYCELIRTIGLLSAFKGTQTIAKAPLYDHRNLGECYALATGILAKLLGLLAVHNNIHRPFVVGAGRMEVDLEPEWIQSKRKLYVRVNGAGSFEETARKMSSVKFCAPMHFAQVVQRRMQALSVQWLRRPPSSLPPAEGGVYGEIVQTGQFWYAVQNEQMMVVGGSEDLPYHFDLFVE